MPEAAFGDTAGFARSVVDGGYAWWYLDAVSADGRHGLTVIWFVGSVFSPYYAWARAHGDGTAPAENHVSCNVALYGPAARWAMTERGNAAIARTPGHLVIGPSSMVFDGTRLVAALNEITVPWPRRLAGRLELTPRITNTISYALDAGGRHHWCPLWPAADIRVTFDSPQLDWSGHAYVDHNHGSEPLEAAFDHWHWSRSVAGDDARLRYEVTRLDGSTQYLGLRFAGDGRIDALRPAPLQRLPATPLWRIPRATRANGTVRVKRTFEDTPFYARSLLDIEEPDSAPAQIIHESLSLGRFRSPIVRWMLPFRMPRRA